MPSSGHRLRDVEHHPLLSENDSYDSAASSPADADAADRVWFIRDGCGMICAVLTWLLVVYADFVVTFVMLLPSKDFWYSVVNGVVFNCLAVLALSSHLRTMLTDPVSARPRRAFLPGLGWGDTSSCGRRVSHSHGLGGQVPGHRLATWSSASPPWAAHLSSEHVGALLGGWGSRALLWSSECVSMRTKGRHS